MENTKKGINVGKALMMGTALVTLSSYQAEAVTGTGQMSAIILTPITVTQTQAMRFGSITVTTGTGTIAVDTTGTRGAPTGSVTAVTGVTTPQEGIMKITAGTGLVMDVVVTAATFTVDDGGAGLAMNVNGFNLKTTAGGPTVTTSIAAGTTAQIPVGATLNVPAGQAAAVSGITPVTFTGAYTIDVTYQ